MSVNYLKIFLILLFLVSCKDQAFKQVQGNFTVQLDSIPTIVESGLLQSVNSSSVKTPGNWRMEYRIAFLVPEASIVTEGDTVVRFDTEQARSQFDEARSKLELQQAKLNETVEKNALDLAQKENSLNQLEIQQQINTSKLENARFESDVTRKEMELELQKTSLRLVKAREDLESQKILNANKENLIRLEIRQALVKIERANKMMADMFLVAPRGGLVIYQKPGWGGGKEKVKVGDNVHPQAVILSIPDLDAMKATVRLNEVDRPYVKKGMRAEVIVEAYPDTSFKGEVVFVSRIVNRNNGSRNVKTYDVDIKIDSAENYRLKPGLSAKVTLFADKLENTFRVPGWCLFSENQAHFVLSKNNEKHDVTLVHLNDGMAFVQGNLEEGIELQFNSKIPLGD